MVIFRCFYLFAINDVIAHNAYFQHWAQKHLRIYTKEFAHRMTQILPPKKSSHSPAPSTDAAAQLAQVWRETDLGDEWQDAGLPELVRYLVGARGLKVPPQWEWIIPTQL